MPKEAPPSSRRSPLERFRAGELDLAGYLDAKINEATSHLRGLPAAQLHEIRSILRDCLETDPALVDLVREATTVSGN